MNDPKTLLVTLAEKLEKNELLRIQQHSDGWLVVRALGQAIRETAATLPDCPTCQGLGVIKPEMSDVKPCPSCGSPADEPTVRLSDAQATAHIAVEYAREVERLKGEIAREIGYRETLQEEGHEQRKELEALKGELEGARDEILIERGLVKILRSSLAKAQADGVALREALNAYREALSDGPENCSFMKYEQVDAMAKQALSPSSTSTFVPASRLEEVLRLAEGMASKLNDVLHRCRFYSDEERRGVRRALLDFANYTEKAKLQFEGREG